MPEEPPKDYVSFKLDVCPTCGYSLVGSPAEGTCPECGIEYDDTAMILYGWARGWRATPSNSRGLRFFVALVPLVYVWQIFLPMTPTYLRIWLAATWVAFIAISLIRRKGNDLPGGIQIRMNRGGIVQIDDVGHLRKNEGAVPSFYAWEQLEIKTWKLLRNNRLRVRMKYLVPLYVIPFAVSYPVNAEINCDKFNDGELREMIRRWQAYDPYGIKRACLRSGI